MFGLAKRIIANERRDVIIPDDVFARAQIVANRDEGDTHVVEMYDPATNKTFYEYTDALGNWLGEAEG